MDGGEEQVGLRPRWLYIGAAVVVVTAIAFVAFVFLTVAFFMHAAGNAMAGM